MKAWLILMLAGILEIIWAVGLKYTDGFSRLLPTTLVLLVALASVYLLSVALRDLPVGTAYAIWTGIGATGVAIVGMLLFGESASLLRIFFILLIVAGIMGLKFFTPAG